MYAKICFLFFFVIMQVHAFDHTHQNFSEILQKHTLTNLGQTWVNYSEMRSQSRTALQQYLKDLEKLSADEFAQFSKNERLAFLLNAYNAFTLEWIALHYPVNSIKDTGSIFSSPWKKTFPGFKLLGQSFTLDKIEHEWIRENFNEPRIHFAVNCASQGCPSLRRKAFSAIGLEEELKEVEEEFFLNTRHFRLEGTKASVSSILDWYGDDFKKVHGSLAKYLGKKAQEYGISSALVHNINISFTDYDWSLNGK